LTSTLSLSALNASSPIFSDAEQVGEIGKLV